MNDATPSSKLRLTAPIGLLQRILRRVELEKIRYSVRRSLAAWCSLTLISIVGLVFAGMFFYQEAAASGLGGYMSQLWLIVSVNPSLVLAHWNEILTSISETLPIIGLATVIVTVGLVLWSADKVVGFGRKWKIV